MAVEPSPLYCTCTPVRETEFDGSQGSTLAIAIVEAVADAEDVDLAEVDLLFEGFDPEVLNSLFETSGNPSDQAIRLQITLNRWEIYVRGDGMIRVCDPRQPAEPAPVFDRPIEQSA